MPLNRTTRLLLFIPLALLALLFSLAVLISVFYEKEVKQMMIAQLNKHLRAEIKVNDFNLSVIRNFPFASFQMTDVLVKEAGDPSKADTLLYADRVALLFNLTGLLDNDFTIRRIVVSDGLSHIRIDKQGHPNYEIWEADTASSSSDIDLSKVELKNMSLTYADLQNDEDYSFVFDNLTFSGLFSEKVYAMKANGNLTVEQLKSGSVNWIKNKKAAITASLEVNTDSSSYRFNDCSIQLADIKFQLSGLVVNKDELDLDLAVAADEADLGSFISLLPDQYVSYFRKFESSGRFVFNAAIKGTSSEKQSPGVKADFSIRNGKLIPDGSDIPLQAIELSGSLNSAALNGRGLLSIPTLRARLGSNEITARLSLEDLQQPYLQLKATTRVELAALRSFLAMDTLTALSGTADIDVNFAGKVKDLPRANAANLYSIKSSGSIKLANVSLSLKDNPLAFSYFNGQLELNNDDIIVHDFSGAVSSTDFRLQGRFVNFITFLLIPGQSAEMNAALSSHLINLDELLLNNVTTTKSDTVYKLRVNPRLVCNLSVRVDELQFRRFRASDLSGQIHLENQLLTGNDIRFNAMQGSVLMDGLINVSRKDSILMSCSAQLTKLDIKQLFYEFENFDQDVMTDRNVRGRATASVQFRSSWTTDLNIDPSRVKAICDLTIENGELNDFGPIMELSKYLKLKDLRNIRFSTLKNTISISDRKIFIPSMEIKSSALDISGSGIHDFDNVIDYKIKLLLSDVLGKKVKSSNSEFGEIEDDGLGRTQLYLSMKGTVDNPKISYDRKAVGEKIKQEAKQEKEQLKQLLRDEFGGKKKQEQKPAEPPKKKKEELEIEW
jgi:hypothetical protein